MYISSSVPWAYIVGKIQLKSDITTYGDNNPGTVNVFRAGSILWGMISAFLEISKSALPILFTITISQMSDSTMLLCILSSLIGHGFSPFLKFKGGKSLAVTAGTWLAITKGEAFYILGSSLIFLKTLQKNDAITVTFAFSTLYIYIILRNTTSFETESLLYGITFNLLFIIFKHRKEYNQKLNFRSIRK